MRDRGRLFVAGIAALLLAGCAGQAGQVVQPTAPDSLQAIYQRSIAAAAVKSESAEKPLWPITEDEVTVAHLDHHKTVSSAYYVWVSRPEELRPFCKGKPVPLLALQMALGMPPETGGEVKVFTFTVRRVDLFRPCASSQDPKRPKCELKLDETGQPTSKDEHYVLAQMMKSYRTKDAYPFTAMGWSYNWDPAAPTPQGISEYVLRPGSVRRNEKSVSPAEFCAERPPPS